jgi:hypothetical protein
MKKQVTLYDYSATVLMMSEHKTKHENVVISSFQRSKQNFMVWALWKTTKLALEKNMICVTMVQIKKGLPLINHLKTKEQEHVNI